MCTQLPHYHYFPFFFLQTRHSGTSHVGIVIFMLKISVITGPRYPEGSRKLRFPDYVTIARDGGKVVSLTHRPLFTPRKCSWYSFLLEAESTPGP